METSEGERMDHERGHALMSRAAEVTVPLVRGLGPDDLGLLTPCAEYDVRGLVNHLYGVAVMFEALGRKEEAPADVLKRDHLEDRWQEAFETRVAELLAVWRRPEAYEGMTPGLGLPAGTAARMVVCDLVVHGWDLARALGRPYRVDDEVAEDVLGFVTMMAPQGREFGVFGEPVPAPDDAPVLDRALALSGRDPHWARP